MTAPVKAHHRRPARTPTPPPTPSPPLRRFRTGARRSSTRLGLRGLTSDGEEPQAVSPSGDSETYFGAYRLIEACVNRTTGRLIAAPAPICRALFRAL